MFINKNKDQLNIKYGIIFGIFSALFGFIGTLLFFTSLAQIGAHLLEHNNEGLLTFICSLVLEALGLILGIISWRKLKGRVLIISCIGIFLTIFPLIFLVIIQVR